MSRTVFVNGDYLPESEGKISIFDRGFLFADGVYEVTAVVNGKLVVREGRLLTVDERKLAARHNALAAVLVNG